MKIAQIASLYSPYIGGGAERTAERIALGLVKLGHTVEVISIGPQCENLSEKTESGLPVSRLSRKNIFFHHKSKEFAPWKKMIFHSVDSYNIKIEFNVIKELKRINPDIALIHNLQGLSVSVWSACKKLNIPIVQVLHDYYLLCPKVTLHKNGVNCESQCHSCGVFRVPHKYISNKLSAVVGVSQFILDKHLAFGMFKNVPLKKVIRNANFIAPVKKLKIKENNSVVMGFIVSLSEVKGIELLCEAFLDLVKITQKKITLKVAGAGEENYVNYLKAKFNHKDIHFIGPVVSDDFYPIVDFTVVPSIWHEPLGNIVYESMAKGVPVIGSKFGGIPEMIQDNLNGLTFDPENKQSLLEAMLKLVEDSVLLSEMSAKTRDSIVSFLDVESWLEMYDQLLTNVVAEIENN